jgi:hypothetical protein
VLVCFFALFLPFLFVFGGDCVEARIVFSGVLLIGCPASGQFWFEGFFVVERLFIFGALFLFFVRLW